MTKEEVLHLARLSRIKLSDTEVKQFAGEIDSIVSYVSQLNDIVAEGGITKQPGAVYNVFREDEVTNESGSNTEVLMKEMPETKGRFLKVKKILDTGE